MVDVQFFKPGSPVPFLQPKRADARYFGNLARQDFVEQMERQAQREGRSLFVATEEGDLVAQGVTEIHKVLADDDGILRLSGSHAMHRVAPNLLKPVVGLTYEVSIDPATNAILTAAISQEQEPPEPEPSQFPVDPWTLPELRAEIVTDFFSRVQRQPHIPFQYPADGCWARAHEMCRLIERYFDSDPRDVVAKVWSSGFLKVSTTNNPHCEVGWFYHVAPVVRVATELLVIDPALFEKPKSVAEWLSVQQGHLGPLYTSMYAYKPSESIGQAYVREEVNGTEVDLRRFRDKLAGQIYCHGPLPYRC